MGSRVLLAAAVMIATALAGCANGDYLGLPAPEGPQPPADDNVTAEPGNETTPPPEGPGAQPTGTLLLTLDVDNVTVGEAFDVHLNFYHPGREPRPASNGTGNGTENGTANENATANPGHPGTPAYHDDVYWVLDVTLGNETLGFNGTSVPAMVTVSLDQAGNATIFGHITLAQNETVHAKPVMLPVMGNETSKPFAVLTESWTAGATDGPMLADYFTCASTPASGGTHVSFELPDGAGGRTFTATIGAETGIESIVDWGFYAFDAVACDGSNEQFYGEMVAPAGGGVTGTVSGTLPDGANFVTAYSSGGGMVEMEIAID